MMKFTFLQKKKGFALLETVIALSLILAVGLAGLHVMVSTTTAEAKNNTLFCAVHLGEDSLACFRFAEKEETMTAALLKLDENFSHRQGSSVYELDHGEFLVTVTADFENESFSYCALRPNGDVIYEIHI